MKAITKKDLGKHYDTKYFCGAVSVKRYTEGYEIKLYKQPRVFITNYLASLLSIMMKQRDEALRTLEKIDNEEKNED